MLSSVSYWQTKFAISDYSNAYKVLSALNPNIYNYPDYYALMASAAVELKMYSQASGVYTRLVKIYPNNGNWWAGLGIAQQSSGNYNRAMHAYQRGFVIG